MSEEPLNAMEGRARRRASPAGMRTRPARVEPEPPPPTKKHEQGATRVAVVYYLCRNHQLEHPHFMEVPLASPQGLYLRDVISRLDALRGKGMAAKYSWSCKRRYKNWFVWHDLSDGDLLLPAQGAEYVLKGSELQLDQSTPDCQQNSTSTSNAEVQLPKPTRQQEPPPAAVVPVTKEAVPMPPSQPALLSSPSASTIGYDEQCRMPCSGSSSDSSPKTSTPSSGSSSPGPNNPAVGHDTATQTDIAGVTPEMPEIVDEPRPKRHPPAGEHPRGRRSGTLQSLIRAEAAGRHRGLLEEDDERSATTTGSVSGRLRPANLLARLMACGANNPSIGFVQASYKPAGRFTRLEYPSSSPELSPLGVLEPGTAGASTVRGSETENYSGGLHDSGAGKLSSSSRMQSTGGILMSRIRCRVHDGAHSSRGDSVHLSGSTSKRMSGKTPSSKDDEKEKVIETE